MAANFEVFVHRNSDNLHLIITGDFDDGSAYELFHSLRKNYMGEYKVFLHTSRLRQICPSGVETFSNSLRTFGLDRKSLIFTGDYGAQIAPEGSICL